MAARKFTPADKAAIIVASLGEDLAPDVFRQLQKDDASKIGRSLQNLGRLELPEVEEVLKEFLTILQSPKIKTLDAKGFIQKMGTKLGKDGRSLSDTFGKPEYTMRVFDRTRPDLLYRIIAEETPQTLALILSHAPSPFAAALIKCFPEKARLDVLIRMAKLLEVDPLLIEELDDHLVRELEKQGHAGSQKIGGVKKVAEILNALNQDGSALLGRLAERNSPLADEIQQQMFSFEDLVKIDGKGIGELIKEIKRETLTLALRGAAESIILKFLSGMSSRSAQMFREDLEAMGAQKKSDVDKARQTMLEHTRKMIESGKIQIESDASQFV